MSHKALPPIDADPSDIAFSMFHKPTRSLHFKNDLAINISQGNCLEVMKGIDPQSVHLVVTDPPYFLDGLDDTWKKAGKVANRKTNKTGSVNGLPVGMNFNPKHGIQLQAYMEQVGALMFQALVPGAFAAVFSQPRLSHRMAIGLENCGFEIRDSLAWRFTKRAQFKAFSMDHFVEKMDIPEAEKRAIKRDMRDKKTPQLRPQFESVILAQKPREGTFINNWREYATGLIDVNAKLDGKSPSTVMTFEKPINKNGHLTPKPVNLVEHLIRLLSCPGQVVLDPFLGSGTTAIAASRQGRSCIGIEINDEYIKLANRRLQEDSR